MTQRTNNVLRTIYAYRYAGKATDLTIGEGVGFEAWPIDQLLNLNEEEKKRFIPFLVGPESLKLFQKIRQLIEKSKR